MIKVKFFVGNIVGNFGKFVQLVICVKVDYVLNLGKQKKIKNISVGSKSIQFIKL